VNWLGDGTVDAALDGGSLEVFIKVRSTRPPRPAWLKRSHDGIEVELVASEEGVAPGQACVFYDAAEGQARVLGGGFIRHAAPGVERAGRVERSTPAVAAMRG